MPDNGYVKVFRSLEHKGYYKDSNYIHLWLHLLMHATYQEKEFLFAGKIHHLKPGQCIVGRRKMAVDTGIQESKIERILNVFKSEHQIEQQSFTKFRIITICNWEKYQVSEQQNEQPVNSERTTSEQQVNTNKKDKKDKKDKIPIDLPEWLDPEIWKAFKEHRIKLRKPMTRKAEEIVIAKLVDLKNKNYNPRHLIITAIERGWLSVFEPKELT